jgi:hypothetical protein
MVATVETFQAELEAFGRLRGTTSSEIILGLSQK